VTREEIKAELTRLYQEWHTGHGMHWDPEGTSGRNCPACKLDSALREGLRNLIARAQD
jgi:hypothetical protein